MAGMGFFVRPGAGQEGVPARDKLWRLAGADAEHYGEHMSFVYTCFATDDRDAIGRLMWSLLSST
jgi:hypothetical protein